MQTVFFTTFVAFGAAIRSINVAAASVCHHPHDWKLCFSFRSIVCGHAAVTIGAGKVIPVDGLIEPFAGG
ncbi:hypothetical protein [Bacillus changyiensis]|uniref:hypothetical protein n=1 Tax=Bacillus changyiensis TaxID=3004103 RepID=UPI0022E989C6|nr:hypothetical protein [Bacillus changyiensis]MDA1477935.1 hypothetical protein [Bacillus changyiensis]